MMLSALFLFLAGSSISVSAKRECPSDLTACTCEFRHWPEVTCEEIKSEDELKSDFNALKGYEIDTFIIKNMIVPRVDLDFYEGLNIKNLEISNVSVIEDSFKEGLKSFQGLEDSLTVLEINNCYHTGTTLKYLKLDHLEKLKILMMSNNKVDQIGNDWFQEGPNSVYSVLLENNDIKTLGNKAFSSLKNLEIIWVRGNPLSEVSRSMFPSPAPVLEKLDLSSNRITKLPRDLFTDMPSLRIVLLNNNLINSISEETWPSNLLTTTNIYLQGNPLQCDNDLKWLCKIKANIKRAKCESPIDKNGVTLNSFCDA